MATAKAKAKVNIFDKARSSAKEGPAKKNTDKAEVNLPGLSLYNAADQVEKRVKAWKETLKLEPQAESVKFFHDEVERTQKVPESFEGIDGEARANVQYRNRGSNSPLKPEEKSLLDLAGVPTKTIGVFSLKDEVAENEELMGKIAAVLEKNFPNIDMFNYKEKTVVTEDTLNTIVKKDREHIDLLLPLATTFAIRPAKVEEGSADRTFVQALETLMAAVQPDKVPVKGVDK